MHTKSSLSFAVHPTSLTTGWWLGIVVLVAGGGWSNTEAVSNDLWTPFNTKNNYNNVGDSLLSRLRKPRNTYESMDTLEPQPAKFLFMRNAPRLNTEIKLQDSVVLECEAGGSPPPTIHWLKDGSKIQQEDFMVTNALPDSEASPFGLSSTKSRLFVDCMTPKEEGLYTCVADTPYQRVNANTKVFLSTNLPAELNPSCIPQKKSLAHSGQPARIHMWTARLLQIMGNDAVVFCRAIGDPTPTVEWHIGDDEILESDDKFQILDNGDLLIRQVSWNDMGLYTCVARNGLAKDTITTFLYPMAVSEMSARLLKLLG